MGSQDLVLVTTEGQYKARAVQSMTALGARVSRKGVFEVSISYKLSAVNASYHKESEFCKCRPVSWRDKFQRYVERLRPTLVYAAGA